MLRTSKFLGVSAWVIAVAFLLYQFSIQTAYSVISPTLASSLDLTLADVTLLAAIYTWTYAISQMFGGVLLDRFGSSRLLIPQVVIFITGVYIFSVADSMLLLVIAQVMMAVGASSSFIIAGFIGGEWFGRRRYGLLFGYVQALAGFSSALGTRMIHDMVVADGWRETLWVATLAGIAILIIVAIVFRDPPKDYSDFTQGREHIPFLESVFTLWKSQRTIFVYAAWAGIAFGLQIALGVVWAPRLLKSILNDGDSSALAGSFVWLGLGFGALFWERWSYRINRRKLPLKVGYSLMVVSILLLLFVPDLSRYTVLGLITVFGFANGVHMLAYTCTADRLSPSLVGTASAVINASCFICGGLFIKIPPLLFAIDGPWFIPYLPYVFLLVIGLTLAWFQKETATG